MRDNKAGAPLKAFEPWDNWQNEILDLYKEGASNIEIKCLIMDKMDTTLSNDLWTRWMKDEVKLSETVKRGLIYSQMWWEKVGREGINTDSMQETKKVNYTGWKLNMNNRFAHDWKDKQEIETTEVKTIKVKRAVKK